MTTEEILKAMILKNNSLFNSLGVKLVMVYNPITEVTDEAVIKKNPPINSCCFNAKSDDGKVFVDSKYLDEWKPEIFGFRDWGKINSILSMFPKDFNLNAKKDTHNSLSILTFLSDDVKVKHCLQAKRFIKIQEESNGEYKNAKFALKSVNNSNVVFNSDIIRQMSRASSILDEKQFKFVIEEDKLYAVFGEDSLSTDNIKILIGMFNSDLSSMSESQPFPFESFSAVLKNYNNMSGQNYFNISPALISVTNVDDKLITTTIIRTRS